MRNGSGRRYARPDWLALAGFPACGIPEPAGAWVVCDGRPGCRRVCGWGVAPILDHESSPWRGRDREGRRPSPRELRPTLQRPGRPSGGDTGKVASWWRLVSPPRPRLRTPSCTTAPADGRDDARVVHNAEAIANGVCTFCRTQTQSRMPVLPRLHPSGAAPGATWSDASGDAWRRQEAWCWPACADGGTSPPREATRIRSPT
jgi:hypothetical protein